MRPERTSILNRAGPAVRREDDATARLRFVAVKVEIEEGGLRCWCAGAEPRFVAWADIGLVAVRQLPTDAPWDGSLLLDVVPHPSSGSNVPIRIARITSIHFRGLPGGPAASRQENLRRLGRHLMDGGASPDAESAAFFAGRECPRLGSVSQLLELDSRYAS